MTQKRTHNLHKLFQDKSVEEAFAILRSLCGPTRFEIILALSKHKNGLTVSELAHILEASLSRISHQLRILKKDKLVRGKPMNRNVCYQLTNHHIRRHFASL